MKAAAEQSDCETPPAGRSPSPPMERRPETPSNYSIASSNSPLVRNGSASSSSSTSSTASILRSARASGSAPMRRPEPTSIAAAQLQCQQQRLEFVNKLNQQQQQQHKSKKVASQILSSKKSNKLPLDESHWMGEKQPEEKKAKKSVDENKLSGHSRGFGQLNLADFLSFRSNDHNDASRFAGFWSANKIRYMNFACLFMALVCLLTILLFSSGGVTSSRSSSSSGGINSALSDLSESIEKLDRQPLVSSPDDQQPDASSGPAALATDQSDELEQAANSNGQRTGPVSGRKLKRKLDDEPAAADSKRIQGEREVEETTTTSSSSSTPANNQLDPIITRLLDDFESSDLGAGLFKSAGGKSHVRRTKNGATIIISSTAPLATDLAANGTESKSTAAARPFVSLLDRLLRPGFSGRTQPTGFATITIRSEPMLSSFAGRHPAQTEVDSPFGALVSSSPMLSRFSSPMFPPLPPSAGLFDMLLRASSGLGERDESERVDSLETNSNKSSSSKEQQSQANATNNLSTQASQLNQTTLQLNATTAAGASNSSAAEQQPEVVTFDASRRQPAARIIITSGSSLSPFAAGSSLSPFFESPFSGRARPPFGSSPFLMPYPTLQQRPAALFSGPRVMLASNSAGDQMSPLLRSLMDNFLSDIQAETSADQQQQQQQHEQQAQSKPTGIWFMPSAVRRFDSSSAAGGWQPEISPPLPLNSIDTSEPASDWDEREPTLRGRQQTDAADDSEPVSSQSEASEQPAGGQSSSSLIEHLIESAVSSQSGVGAAPNSIQSAGTIRQTFRAPGVTIARIVKIPRSRVAPNVRSQSISRMDDNAELYDGEQQVRPVMFGPLGGVPEPPVGFIGRLLADVSRRSQELERSGADDEPEQQQDKAEESTGDEHAASHRPAKVRLATARIRIRPSAMEVASEVSGQPESMQQPAANAAANQSQETEEKSGDNKNNAAAAYTSPNSPLFGFPALSSFSQQQPEQQKRAAGESQRRQRAFTYHSNHELAGAQKPQEEPLARSQLMGNLPPPAGLVMGRRLDDGPFGQAE